MHECARRKRFNCARRASFGYDLDTTLDENPPAYEFLVSCQKSVPQAIRAFLESDNFEDAVRKIERRKPIRAATFGVVGRLAPCVRGRCRRETLFEHIERRSGKHRHGLHRQCRAHIFVGWY